MKMRERVDDYGDDYGSRVDRIPSSIVIVAVVVNRNGKRVVVRYPVVRATMMVTY
jgi:hypothetical protein